tara:strand:- start:283 stop:519 length:237 start_codon:yes stop_codon:yes gene_type:complete
VSSSLDTPSSICKEVRTLLGGVSDMQRYEGSGQPVLMKVLKLDASLVTGQRLESTVGVIEPSIVCGHRVGGHAIDPGE